MLPFHQDLELVSDDQSLMIQVKFQKMSLLCHISEEKKWHEKLFQFIYLCIYLSLT